MNSPLLAYSSEVWMLAKKKQQQQRTEPAETKFNNNATAYIRRTSYASIIYLSIKYTYYLLWSSRFF